MDSLVFINKVMYVCLCLCLSLVSVFLVGLLEPAEVAHLTAGLIRCTVSAGDCVRVKLSSVTPVRFALLTDLMIRKVDTFLKCWCLVYTSKSLDSSV